MSADPAIDVQLPMEQPEEGASSAAKKKKRNKNKGGEAKPFVADVDPELYASFCPGQTCPPSVEVATFFADKPYPQGMLLWTAERCATDVDSALQADIDNVPYGELRQYYRQAAQIHKQVRMYAREVIKPGVDLFKASEDIEMRLRLLCGRGAMEMATYKAPSTDASAQGDAPFCAQAFPLGLSVNNCAAHYSPLRQDNHTVSKNDVIKVDFGVHCNGYIIDSAFSLHFNPVYDTLCQASYEATTEAIKVAGADVNIYELGNKIEEIICSYEIDYDGRNVLSPLQPVRNLCGHMVNKYKIHDGKSIPNHKGATASVGRMKEGEVYACETFASSGKGWVENEMPASHFMVSSKAFGLPSAFIKGSAQAKKLFNVLRQQFGTIAWCPRWIDSSLRLGSASPFDGLADYSLALGQLCSLGYVHDYPKLSDIKGCHVAQFEHTFMVMDGKKEVFSKGDDY